MRKELSLIDRMNSLLRLDLNHDLSVDDQVRTEPTIQFDGIIDQRYSPLPLHVKRSLVKFVEQASFVSGLEQSRSESSVNCYCRSDDLFGSTRASHVRPQELLYCGRCS